MSVRNHITSPCPPPSLDHITDQAGSSYETVSFFLLTTQKKSFALPYRIYLYIEKKPQMYISAVVLIGIKKEVLSVNIRVSVSRESRSPSRLSFLPEKARGQNKNKTKNIKPHLLCCFCCFCCCHATREKKGTRMKIRHEYVSSDKPNREEITTDQPDQSPV